MDFVNKRSQTIKTYNDGAVAFANKFDSLGARIMDIKETFLLVDKKNPNVLEIGCGNGRDAKEIIKYTSNYLGIDLSEKLVDLAKEKLPDVRFKVDDIVTSKFTSNLDVVFAFASLIHVTKDEFKRILKKLHNSLNDKGIVRISLKYNDEYEEVEEEGEFGIRTYYYYSQKDVEEMSSKFTILKSEVLKQGKIQWLEIILKK